MHKFPLFISIIFILFSGCTRKPRLNTEIEIICYRINRYDSSFAVSMVSGYYATIDLDGNCKYVGNPNGRLLPAFYEFDIDKNMLSRLLQNFEKIPGDSCILSNYAFSQTQYIRFIYKSNDFSKIITTERNSGKNFYTEFYENINKHAERNNYSLVVPNNLLKKRNKLILQISMNKLPYYPFMEPIGRPGIPYKVLIDTISQ